MGFVTALNWIRWLVWGGICSDTQLTPIIQSIFANNRATYANRRIRQTLTRQDLAV